MGEFRVVALTHEEKKLKRREYFREKQREYRKKVNHDVAIVEEEIEQLEAILRKHQKPGNNGILIANDGALSWSVISSVFRRESLLSKNENTSLIDQTRKYAILMGEMQRFVVSNIPASMPRSSYTWPCASLMAEPDARKLGKEWLTQQMYYNMDSTLHFFPSHHTNEEFCHIDVDLSEESIRIVEVVQNNWPITFEHFKYFLQHRMRSIIFKDPTNVNEETTGNTRLYRFTTEKGSFINILQGNFVEADRFIVVMRQVEADESFNSRPYRQQHHMSWLEVRRLSATNIITRLLYHGTQHYREEEGPVSMDEQADIWGIDLSGIPEDEKRERIRQDYIRLSHEDENPWRKRILDMYKASSSFDISIT